MFLQHRMVKIMKWKTQNESCLIENTGWVQFWKVQDSILQGSAIVLISEDDYVKEKVR